MNPMTVFLYSTAPDRETAKAIARALVHSAAAACVNIIPGMTSVYRWRERIEESDEVVLIVKTTAAKAAAARHLILAHHPYETPAVAAIAIDEGRSHRPFLDWISDACGR